MKFLFQPFFVTIPSMIKVILLDLGKVIINFDYQKAAAEIQRFTDASLQEMSEVFLDGDLIYRYETGRMSSSEFYQVVSRRLRLNVSASQFKDLWGSMFLEEPLLSDALLEALKQKYRLILLSNTNEIHFQYVQERYPILRHVSEHVLSFREGTMKPEPEIYQAAIRKAGVAPDRIFFTDDRADNVAAARQLGIQAAQFQGEQQLRTQLQEIGIHLNPF
ncbi:MAG: HAD family phosphatase [Acidobacteriota bacterium]